MLYKQPVFSCPDHKRIEKDERFAPLVIRPTVMARVFIWILLALLASNDGLPLFGRENIILVPSVAFRAHSTAGSTDWLLYNQGWYYEEDPIQAVIMEKSLEKVIKKDLDISRIRMFTADGKERQPLCIDGLNRTMCTRTDDEGRIKNTFQMRHDEIRKVLYQVSDAKKNVRTTG
jgi:hypothetical protein